MHGTAAIVGAGIVSPAGCTLDALWSALVAAEATEAELTTYPDIGDLPVVTCRARGFEPTERFERHELRRLDRSHVMAMFAADDALQQAGPGPAADRCAIVVGTGLGGAEFLQNQFQVLLQNGARMVSPLTIPVSMPNSVAAHLSIRYGFTGPSNTVTLACASGAAAIGEALWLLRTGRADRVLAGAVEAPHSSAVAAFFTRMEAMSSNFESPRNACRPFDLARDGLVLGEGAAFVVLERSDQTHGEVLGTVLGYATNSDAHHLVAPSPAGEGAAACMRAALADAGLDPGSIGHVNAHGTSTPRNDIAESQAIDAVFGGRPVPVTATKSVIGHLIGAAGAVEAIASVLANRRGVVPPIANLTDPDPEVTATLARTPVPLDSPVALSNSLGFGGHNATLILG